MPEDENLGEEFNRLIERMSDEHAPRTVEIIEVAETASMVEVVVPITVYPDPEVVLLRAMAEYLAATARRAIVAVSISYEIRSHNLPFLVGNFMLSEPVE